MQKNKGFSAFNLGNGEGFSILEVIKGCERVANTKIPFQIDERRKGDPAVLVSDSKLALETLKWNPDINDIIKSVWECHKI
jgi:UDP-glucose 4-epimerase